MQVKKVRGRTRDYENNLSGITLYMNQESVVEDYPIRIILDYHIGDFRNDYTCPHVKNGRLKAVVGASNEGDCCGTIVCLECLQSLDIDSLYSQYMKGEKQNGKK